MTSRVAAWAFRVMLSSVSNSSPGTCSALISEPSRSRTVFASTSRAYGRRSPAWASFLLQAAAPSHLFVISRSSRRVAVSAPALPVLHPRAFAHPGDPQVEHPRLAQTREIADAVDRQRRGQGEEAAGDE